MAIVYLTQNTELLIIVKIKEKNKTKNKINLRKNNYSEILV